MRGIGGSTLRGGQTVFHGLRMWGQLLRAALFLSALSVVAVPAWTVWRSTSGAELYAVGMVTLAEVKLAIGYRPDSGQEVRMSDGTRRALRIRDIAASVPALQARQRILDTILAGARLGAMAGAGMVALFLAAFWWRGDPSRAAEADKGRRDGDGRAAAPTGDAAARARPGHSAGRREGPSLQHRRDPVP